KSGEVWVNGEKQVLDLPMSQAKINLSKQRILEDQVFVLNDNRAKEQDSRSFGPVPIKLIQGEVLKVIRSQAVNQ
ncbi:MAG: S26 family signal peptidase, partial [Bdellovibrionales bacterium]|nr:S26 family signal peptidase [Bdellovibrionales bacterium]